ncbi:hypothetical protein HDU67_006553 [Dinochytrium kinnereticum]|nr:hypothetical protein HDU67_006553 [Dinochytrium kinnereticum]
MLDDVLGAFLLASPPPLVPTDSSICILDEDLTTTTSSPATANTSLPWEVPGPSPSKDPSSIKPIDAASPCLSPVGEASSKLSADDPSPFLAFKGLSTSNPNTLSHRISWSVASERGYRNLVSPYPVRHPIHTEIEDMHWPTLQERTPWESGLLGRGDDYGLVAMDDREDGLKEFLDDLEEGRPFTSSVDISQTTRIMVLADGHGGVGAARFFVPRIRSAMQDLMQSKEWDFHLPLDQQEFRQKSRDIFLDLDAEYVAEKVASYRRWRHDILLNTQDGAFDGDNPSRKHKMTRPPDDGCTLVVTLLHGGFVVNLNVGDSRTVLASRPALVGGEGGEGVMGGKGSSEVRGREGLEEGVREEEEEDEEDGSFVSECSGEVHPMVVSSLLKSPSPPPSASSSFAAAAHVSQPLASSSSSSSYPPSSFHHSNPPASSSSASFTPTPSWPADLSDLSPDLEWRIDFASSDHNMTHPGKVWSIHSRGGRFINPDGTPRLVLDALVPPEARGYEPYHELRGARIHRPPNDTVRSAGISHRRTLNLTATMGDVLFKVDPPVLTPEPDVTFLLLDPSRDYTLVMATDGVWDHLRSQFRLTLRETPPPSDDPAVPTPVVSHLLPSSSALSAFLLGPDATVFGLREDVCALPESVLEAFGGRLTGPWGGEAADPVVLVEGDDIQNAMVVSVVTAAVDAAVRESTSPRGVGGSSGGFGETMAIGKAERLDSLRTVPGEEEMEGIEVEGGSVEGVIESPFPRRSVIIETDCPPPPSCTSTTTTTPAPTPIPSPTPSTTSSVSSSSTAVSPAGPTLADRLAGAAASLVQREIPAGRREAGGGFFVGGGRSAESPEALTEEEAGEVFLGRRGGGKVGGGLGGAEGLFHQGQQRYDDATAFVKRYDVGSCFMFVG